MECKELFIFENGQPLTTPPPQVSFWAFRLTVKLKCSPMKRCGFNDCRSECEQPLGGAESLVARAGHTAGQIYHDGGDFDHV